MQTLLSVSILAANVAIQSFILLIKEKESKKSVVTALSKKRKEDRVSAAAEGGGQINNTFHIEESTAVS
jgi:hypothetical protein